ncbi:hypothetical protein RFI_15080, partial [Reticulomyxa filosa]
NPDKMHEGLPSDLLKKINEDQINRSFNNLEISDARDCIVKFVMPSECKRIELIFRTQIRKTNGTLENVSKSRTYELNQMDQSFEIACAHFIPLAVDKKDHHYQIMVCGKNGEPLQKVKCTLQLKHDLLSNNVSLDCVTDERGLIDLKNMSRITEVQITLGSTNRTLRWHTDMWTQTLFHKNIHILEDEKLHIPYHIRDARDSDCMTKYLLFDKYNANDYSDKVSYDSGYVTICNLKTETMCCDVITIDAFVVIQMQNHRQVCLEGPMIYELTPSETLQIRSVEEQKDEVRVHLGGVTPWTRVHLISTHLMPLYPIYNELIGSRLLECDSGEYNTAPTLYCKEREISEEYRYVLERANAHKYIGNNLQKPSLLIRPFSDKATKTETQDAKKGEKIEHKHYKQRRQVNKGTLITCGAPYLHSNGNWPVLEFLGNNPATTWFNLPCQRDESTGQYYVTIKQKDLNEHHHVLTAVAVNEKYFSVYTHVLKHPNVIVDNANQSSPHKAKYRDVRMHPGLNPQKHFVEQRQIELVKNATNDKVVVEDFKTSQAEVFESLEHVFSLYRSLTKNDQLLEWSFLHQWNKLTDADKLQKFNKFFSHEFNFFIYCKDRPFFDTFVLPLIESKVNKTLLDYWFLGDLAHLRPYLDVAIFIQLNALEQILLAFAFKGDLRAKYHKYFSETQDATKFDPFRFKALFESALAERNFAEAQSLPCQRTSCLMH